MKIIYPKKAKTQWYLRELIVKDYNKSRSSTSTAKKFEISHTTVLKWKNSISLKNKSSAPIIPYRKHSIEQLYLIHFFYKKEEMNLDNIVDTLEWQWLPVPRSTISYNLSKWWLVKERREKWKRINQKFKKYDPWFIHVDITYWPKIDNKKRYLHVAIDRATRIIYFELHDNKRADTAALFLKNAINFFPFGITKVLTDCGKEYTLKYTKTKKDWIKLYWDFDKICDEFWIEHRTTRPYTPQTNWMVEKSNDTIKNGTFKKYKYENLQEMKDSLFIFLKFYNLERRHGWLRAEIWVKTPYEALKYWFELLPEIFKETPEEFKEKLLNLKF